MTDATVKPFSIVCYKKEEESEQSTFFLGLETFRVWDCEALELWISTHSCCFVLTEIIL